MADTEPRPEWILVAAEPITDVDTTAADMLKDLDRKLNATGISLVFAEMKTPVRRKVERYELTDTIDPDHFFDTINEAVHAYQSRAGVDWITKPDSS
jgi:MFS superfamily sulfate permease-like transporter